jgi:hypothetical protein
MTQWAIKLFKSRRVTIKRGGLYFKKLTSVILFPSQIQVLGLWAHNLVFEVKTCIFCPQIPKVNKSIKHWMLLCANMFYWWGHINSQIEFKFHFWVAFPSLISSSVRRISVKKKISQALSVISFFIYWHRGAKRVFKTQKETHPNFTVDTWIFCIVHKSSHEENSYTLRSERIFTYSLLRQQHIKQWNWCLQQHISAHEYTNNNLNWWP